MNVETLKHLNSSIEKNGWSENTPVVVVQGLGFVGAVSAILIANALNNEGKPKYNVIGLDLNNQDGNEKIEKLSKGVFPINSSDPVLEKMLKNCLANRNAIFTNCVECFSLAAVIIVDIPLGLNWETERLDWDPFLAGIESISKYVKEDALIIVETTMPPGTTEERISPLIKNSLKNRNLNDGNIAIAHAYERVMPGPDYWKSVTELPRVYSGIDTASKKRCRTFLGSILPHGDKLLRELPSPRDSETAKVLENSYRAVNIAFIEEWSAFAERIGVDLFEVTKAIRERPTHANIMNPGFGVGGYCLTKDPVFARQAAREIFDIDDNSFPFSSAAVKINNAMPLRNLEYVKKLIGGDLKGKKLYLAGVSYRSDLSDTRLTPSESFVREAEKAGAIVTCFDPYVEYWTELKKNVERNFSFDSTYDALILAVPHKELKELDYSQLKIGSDTIIFDAAGVVSLKQRSELVVSGVKYFSIGRDLSKCFTR